MKDENKGRTNRRKILKTTAVGGIGIIGLSAGTAQARPKQGIHFVEAGYEHAVDFSSLPASRYRDIEDLYEEALEEAELSKSEAAEMSEEKLKEELSFPGDRSKLIDPTISGVNIEVPPDSVAVIEDELHVRSNQNTVAKAISNNDVVVKQESNGIAEDRKPARSTIATDLAGSKSPSRGYSLAPDANYNVPRFNVRSVHSDSTLKIETGSITKTVRASKNEEVEHSKREVKLRLRRYDGSFTTASVNVTPKLKLKNHGRVRPKGVAIND